MSEFFGRLETELRAAAERPPRRLPDLRGAPVALAVALVALALAPIVLVLGSGDEGGAGRRSGDGPERQAPREPGFPGETVVATGTAPVAGPWEILTYESERLADPDTGDVLQPAGLRCIGLRLLDPPADHSGGLSGQCGEFPRTPGFSRSQQTVSNVAGGAREILVYGRVPEEAALIRVTGEGRAPIEVEPFEGPPGERSDFYMVAVPPDIEGRVNWIDAAGDEGSRGIELLPP